MLKRILLSAALCLLLSPLVAPLHAANQIGYVEDFALAKDRDDALKKLIPGTWQYYFFHCLHLQNQGKLDQVDKLLETWSNPQRDHTRMEEIRIRQALLRYDTQPEQSLRFLREKLGLHYPHQRERLGTKPSYPTALDQDILSRQTLTQQSLSTNHVNLSNFEDSALDWLIHQKLTPDQRRHLLERLRRPDHEDLPQMIIEDLDYRHSRGFGAFPIHQALLLDQLDALLKRKPALIHDTQFVHAYLTKLQPSPDVDWRNNPQAHEAYLDRLWSFAQKLEPVHNGIKANILYHRLVFDRSQGVYNRQRFLTYLQIPRQVFYINPRWIAEVRKQEPIANLNIDLRSVCHMPPIGNDYELVRSYLLHFFVEAESYDDYAPYIENDYLKQIFAEAKLVNGIGQADKWSALMSPAALRVLRERIDLEFAPTNKELFNVDDQVKLDLMVKNVDKLIVKVYRINNLNYYLDQWQEVNTDINLDGLVSNNEQTYTYREPPMRRVTRTFTFPGIDQRGTYVVEFIGNGKSSRALIRKGRLQFLLDANTAGHVFLVLNEKREVLKNASIHLGGHHYKSDDKGRIVVPFTSSPGRQPVILVHDNFATLDYFQHEAENYDLTVGFHVDREALASRNKAKVIIRPRLTINGEPAPTELLEDVRLVITSTDRDDISTTSQTTDIKLTDEEEAVHEFAVPDRLKTISFSLHGKIKSISQNQDVQLSGSSTLSVNQVETTDHIADLYLLRTPKGYVLDVLGRTGEKRGDYPVSFAFKHHDFRQIIHVQLKTNGDADKGTIGRIDLGPLDGIELITAHNQHGLKREWRLDAEFATYTATRHAKLGEPLRLPCLGKAKQPQRSELSLLETRGGTFVRDCFRNLAVRDGYIVIDDLPAGDYDLLIKPEDQRILIRIGEGDQKAGFVMGDTRFLQLSQANPAHIVDVTPAEEDIVIQVANVDADTRVHVTATRYMPEFRLFHSLAVAALEPLYMAAPTRESSYVAGRDIGDEYRYIIDRRYLKKFVGNMLPRPELLLNPWAVRSTETGAQTATKGTEYARQQATSASRTGRAASDRDRHGARSDPHSFDFLAEPPTVLPNLLPDKNGRITISRKLLGDRHHLHILAVSPRQTVSRQLVLEEPQPEFLDLRLVKGLDPQKSFTQKKLITAVTKGGKFTIDDLSTTRFAVYDSLSDVYVLYATLNTDPKLAEFRFILDWPNLKPDRQRELYSRYACHELNFFLSQKDPAFFAEVIKTYLANKKDKTFVDWWLLGNKQQAAEYLRPWSYQQLNMAERALLGRLIEEERKKAERHITDLYDLLPPDIDRYNNLFRTALQGSALTSPDELADRLSFGSAVAGGTALGLQPGRGGGGLQGGDTFEGGPRRHRGAVNGIEAEAEAMPVDSARYLREEQSQENTEALARLEDKGKDGREARKRELERAGEADGDFGELGGWRMDEAKLRSQVRRFYRKLQPTLEWAENNYHHLTIDQQDASLIKVNALWRDYAQHEGRTPFLSTNLAEAHSSFAEMMFALAVLDLPFKAEKHKSDIKDRRTLTLNPGSNAVIFHEEIRAAQPAEDKTPILVSQNFFRHGDRYRYEGNEKFDRFVTDEFLARAVYGCQVVITNPTSSPQKLDILMQVPRGAIPVMNHQYTRSVHTDLQPYSTYRYDYYFYFPAAGSFVQFPVHVAKNEKLLGSADPFTFNVVDELSRIDTESWDYISQDNSEGSKQRVLDFLRKHNLGRYNLDRIAWRMNDKDFFLQVIELLRERHSYQHTLWSYGLKHNVVPAIRQYLAHRQDFLNNCGAYIDTTILTIDPVERKSYQHLEYRPLVNARAHQLGPERKIVNDRLHQQYHAFMTILSYRPRLTHEDLMAVTYYMLLQDRVAEGLAFFERVDPDQLATRLQYDYFTACIAWYQQDFKAARAVAEQHKDHPVDRWRKQFAEVLAQIDQIEGKDAKIVDEEDRTQSQTGLAATEPAVDFTITGTTVELTYDNLAEVQVNYYLMDIELLFSRQPFVQGYSSQFSYVQPNQTAALELEKDQRTVKFELPKELQTRNVMVEITAGSIHKSQAYFSNAMTVQINNNYGQLRVTDRETGKALPGVYVKVYARMADGEVKFYKDNYTDPRGRCDYASLNTTELDQVEKFSILVLSEEKGAIVREVEPPQR